jgi:hypothetical protein
VIDSYVFNCQRIHSFKRAWIVVIDDDDDDDDDLKKVVISLLLLAFA